MKLSYEDHGTASVLTLSGELIADQTDNIRRKVLQRFESGVRDIMLNLEHLTLIDSAGLEFLIWLQESATERNGRFRIAHADETIQKILEVTRLDRRFDLYDSIELAAKTLR